ncbi:Integrase core domain-containing protein [Pseudovibrio sp. Tun.PSC04-5.I4]|nr:Integrase core domain-containing protein [Pseudovibrio sp. Tun.PSC04-5.I4]
MSVNLYFVPRCSLSRPETHVRAGYPWSLDFVSDSFTDGRRFRVLAIIDDFSRGCLALVQDISLSGARLVREFEAVIKHRGQVATIVSDNGTEMTNSAVLKFCQDTTLNWHYIAPSKPMQNAFVESFTHSSLGNITPAAFLANNGLEKLTA